MGRPLLAPAWRGRPRRALERTRLRVAVSAATTPGRLGSVPRRSHAALWRHHIRDRDGPCVERVCDDRGVVCEGPVGARWLGRFRIFRYEARCWAGGHIPDIAEAVDSPVRTTDDPERVEGVLRMLRGVPSLTWGRDELRTGEMWNSNSLVAWVLARTGHDMEEIGPPRRGRAPGWDAGLVLADRQLMGLD